MKSYLFDLDGLLIDSETLYFDANKIYFAQLVLNLQKSYMGKVQEKNSPNGSRQLLI
jgi:beta-phosphoglucomutase-like phosphatase (HAD superfamily)